MLIRGRFRLSSVAWQALRFLVVGGATTAIGLCLIYGLIYLGMRPVYANFLGYGLALPLSYLAHAFFSFEYRGRHLETSFRYAIAVGAAYLANLFVLVEAMRAGLNGYAAQLPAMGTYAAVFFLLNRFFVFATEMQRKG